MNDITKFIFGVVLFALFILVAGGCHSTSLGDTRPYEGVGEPDYGPEQTQQYP